MPLHALLADHGADVVEPVDARGEALDERVVDGVEHDDAARRRAPLAGVRERGRERPLDRAVEIGVVADDERVLAAELHAPSSRAGGPPPRRADGRSRAEPVNETRSTRGSSTSGIPASGPRPWSTFSTPCGSPASRQSRPSQSADSGVCSDGFSTDPLPQKIDGERLPGDVRAAAC